MNTAAPGPPYIRVRVILFHWASEHYFRRDLEWLQSAFVQHFGMQTVIWGIPDNGEDMTREVGRRLREFKRQHESDNELIIVAYGGHGEYVESESEGTLRLVAGDSEEDQFVEWSDVQSAYLFPGEKDTLVILDCCYAGAAHRLRFTARKDVLGACAWNETTPRAPRAQSFTKYLKAALESFSVSFTIRELYDRVLSYRPSKNPVYFWRPENPSHEIVLRPLASTCSPSSRDPSAVSVTGQQGKWWVSMFEILIRFGSAFFAIQFRWGTSERGGGNTSGAHEVLSCNSRDSVPGYARERSEFFKVGRVFAVPWSNETNPPNVPSAPEPSGATQKEERVFIVIEQGERSCSALPISTYRGQGAAAPNIEAGDHSIIYMGKMPPKRLPSEVVDGEQAMLPQPIHLVGHETHQNLHPASRINYGRICEICFDVPVRALGTINKCSTSTFEHTFSSVHERKSRSSSPVNQMKTARTDSGSAVPAPVRSATMPASTSARTRRDQAPSTRRESVATPASSNVRAGRYQASSAQRELAKVPASTSDRTRTGQASTAPGPTLTPEQVTALFQQCMSIGYTREQATAYVHNVNQRMAVREQGRGRQNDNDESESDDSEASSEDSE